jgi:hypothetical protein
MTYIDKYVLKGQLGLAILDMGPQNPISLTSEYLNDFLERYGSEDAKENMAALVEELRESSIIKPGVRTLFLAEILDHTELGYESIDVCPGHNTTIVDLNAESLPKKFDGMFDLAMNFGTTEHIFNQYQSFEAMHEATKVGGHMLHQVPTAGWTNHGYFCYHPLFFRELAEANGYIIEDMFWTPAQPHFLKDVDVPIREEMFPYETGTDLRKTMYAEGQIPTFNINVLYRKKNAKKFRVGLEIATTHAPLDANVASSYK